MNKIIQSLFRYAPEIIITSVLVVLQLLGLNLNVVGIYLIGTVLTQENYYKAFILSIFVTAILDSVNIQILGTWALSFFAAATVIELLLFILRLKKEINAATVRGFIILLFSITTAAALQELIQKKLAGQTLAIESIFSIVICGVVFILIHWINSSHSSRDYIKM